MSISPYLVVFITFCSTFIGGLLALKYGKHIHWLNAFSAGILLGAAFFELLPEAINLNGSVREVFAITVIAFLVFYMIQRFVVMHACHEHSKNAKKDIRKHTHDDMHYQPHSHSHDEHEIGHFHKHADDTKQLGLISASGLALHSFLDGSAIGLGFAVSPVVGLTIAIAIIAHDFGDGVSTVTLMLRHKNSKAKAFMLLAIDAIAPVIGAVIFINVSMPQAILGLMLAFFAGFFLYLSTSDLLPEAQRESNNMIIFATVMGAAVMFAITLFVA